MIVVSDAGPVHYLVLIGRIDLLQRAYGRVVVPQRVLEELSRAGTPSPVRQWAARLPDWIDVRTPTDLATFDIDLDPGEAHAISLLLEVGGETLLLADDKDARKAAQALGIASVGTLGLLLKAHQEGIDDLQDALARLEKTNFRSTPALLARVLEIAGKRRSG